VALARSLAPRPRLLLLDEPLSALDRALRERLAGEVRAALVATGTTAIFVTHDHDEAFAVADRIAVMDRGCLLQVAEPVELWHRPTSRRVAEFLGYEAFVPVDDGPPGLGEVIGGLPGGVGKVVGRAWRGARGTRAPGRPTDPARRADLLHGAVLALGPGSLVRDDDGALAGTLVGTVVSSGFRRGVVETVVRVDGVGEVTVVEPSGAFLSATSALPAPGDRLRLRPDPAAIAVVPGS